VGFDPERADADWLLGWMTGRSLARGLPLPFADRGGWRAEIGSDSETRRWVYAGLTPELRELASEIREPKLNLRALATAEAMRAFLPPGWHVQAASYAMTALAEHTAPVPLPSGYRLEMQRGHQAVHAFVLAPDGELAASGHLGIGERAAVADRIVTHPGHRRRGLGSAIMHALVDARPDPSQPQLLVATEMGRQLYEALGWRVLSPYASASYVGDSPVQN
jgi:GNAT superfamily N-acetyltransferase